MQDQSGAEGVMSPGKGETGGVAAEFDRQGKALTQSDTFNILQLFFMRQPHSICDRALPAANTAYA